MARFRETYVARSLMMRFPDSLGVISCRCAIEHGRPIKFVSHAGGDWQMYCSDKEHNFDDEAEMKRDLVVVHVEHLLALDQTLNEIADLPVDMGAERSFVGGPWVRFPNADD